MTQSLLKRIVLRRLNRLIPRLFLLSHKFGYIHLKPFIPPHYTLGNRFFIHPNRRISPISVAKPTSDASTPTIKSIDTSLVSAESYTCVYPSTAIFSPVLIFFFFSCVVRLGSF